LAGLVASALLGLALAASACTGTRQPAPQPPLKNVAEDAPAAERLAVELENLATTLAGSQGDCDQIAAQLYGWTKGHAESYPGLAADASRAPLQAADHAEYKRRVSAALGGVLDAVGRCPEHSGAQAAFTEFDVLLDPRE
jgi:hypothetical protein